MWIVEEAKVTPLGYYGRRKLLLLLVEIVSPQDPVDVWAVPHEVVGKMSLTLANGVEFKANGPNSPPSHIYVM